ncbi:MAG: metal-dependent hydrolase [Desulfobacteraceae bacterium]|nr:metal-dependent hydrolase [Desulfobacteraceae bacterium]MBC2756870.1 metal-dependent hydrolase [Desulfobacteraceae bacterium]
MKKRIIQTETAYSSTPDNIDIEPRRPEFDFSDVSKYWLRDPFTSHFMNALSIVVPHSERTVIDIVRKYADSISDPKLVRDMDALIRQEGRHTLMHLRCNDLLKKCGYPALRLFERFQKFFVGILRRISPPAWELAMPASFEHFTSAISREFIVNQDFWAGDQSNVAIDFTNWHALEELEHQAVCFDVFAALEKRTWLLTLSLLFIWMPATLVSVYGIQLYLLLKDGILLKRKNWGPYLKFIFQSLPMLTRGAFKYVDKGYRPWSQKDVQVYQAHKRQIQNIIS